MRDRQEFWLFDDFSQALVDRPSTKDFGIFISGNGRWVGAEPDVEPISIPGRNGDLTLFNNRWNNVTVQYDCFILKNFRANFEAFRAYLQSEPGYRILVDTYSSGEYRKARVDGYLNINDISWLEDAGSFTVRFSCMPQRFLITGVDETAVYQNYRLTNPTLFNAKPLYRIPANSGGGTFEVYYKPQIAVGDHDKDIYIDCEAEDAYDSDGNSVNNLITLTDDVFPVLEPGVNEYNISFPSNPSMTIYVTPRWFTL